MNINQFLILLISLCLAPFTHCAHGKEIKVMTFNVRYDSASDTGTKDWSHRLPIVASVFQKASIIGAQEVLHRQLNDLRKALPNYSCVGVGRDDGKTRGEFSPIFYDKNQWEIKESGNFWLSKTPEKPGSKHWGNSTTRICTWARLVGSNGAGIYVYNTHFDHRSQASREKAALLIIERVKARKYIDEPVILFGDFNANRDNNAIKTITNSSGLRGKMFVDSWESTKPTNLNPPTFNFWNVKNNKGSKIDFIFHSPALKTISSEILNPHKDKAVASDHNPQFSILEWNAKNQNASIEWKYVEETLLNKEFGGGKGSILRWNEKTIYVKIIGGNKEQLKKAHDAIKEINLALNGTGTSLKISNINHKHEIRCYIGSFDELKKACKKENLSPPDDYAGFASLRWITNTKVIIESTVLIATDRTPAKDLYHVFLEEITQTLGLAGDNTVYPESITYSRGNDHGNTPHLSIYDKKALQFVYRYLKADDNSTRVKQAFKTSWNTLVSPK